MTGPGRTEMDAPSLADTPGFAEAPGFADDNSFTEGKAVRVLVVNAGSSSLKLRVLGEGDWLAGSADLPAPRGTVDAAELESALASLGAVDAVGHRIVHGGIYFTEPVVIEDKVITRLEALTDLAPLHQPKSLAALAAVRAALPAVPGVACFDTAFHASIPAAAATYALPREWRQRWALLGAAPRRVPGIRRPGPAPRCGSSPAISVRAPRWPRCATACRWTRRWVSRRLRAW